MSTLDQAFIRAYNKDRRATSANATHEGQAETGLSSTVPAQALESESSSNSSKDQNTFGTTSESGRWYRVDAAGNLHTHHQPVQESPQVVDSVSIRGPEEASAILPAQENDRDDATVAVIHARHAGHRLPPYPHMTGASSVPAVEQSVHAVQHPSGRRTLASYLAQNQAHTALETEGAAQDFIQPVLTPPTLGANAHSTVPGVHSIGSVTAAPTDRMAGTDRVVGTTKSGVSKSTIPPAISNLAPAENPPLPLNEERAARTITQEVEKSVLKMPAVGQFRGTRTDRPAIHETETAKTKFAATPFPSAWEVDSFTWPEVQTKLLSEQERALSKVAAHLSDACRQGLQVLVVTSPTQGEGRSTVASCIARSVAQRGIQVALVDGDFESPSLADSLNLDIAQGWSNSLLEGIPLEEIAVHSIEDRLTLIPLTAGDLAPKLNHIERYIGAMLDRLRESFDLIVVDATFMNSLDHRLIGTEPHENVDAMILVTDVRNEDQHRLETAVRRIKNLGVSSVGIVENFTNT